MFLNLAAGGVALLQRMPYEFISTPRRNCPAGAAADHRGSAPSAGSPTASHRNIFRRFIAGCIEESKSESLSRHLAGGGAPVLLRTTISALRRRGSGRVP